MEIKLAVVPGKLIKINLPDDSTVLDACKMAHKEHSNIDWVNLAKNNRVRVNYRDYSNTEEIKTESGHYGSILTTPLNESDIVLIFIAK